VLATNFGKNGFSLATKFRLSHLLEVLGRYPTPVQHLTRLSRPECDLWVKRDDLTGVVYGGNKVRRLEYILREALAKGARRVVTFGAGGSHHVLATTVYGARVGLRTAAVLTPQPRTEHAIGNLRAALAQGLEAHPARSFAEVPVTLARVLARGDYVVPPGGSSVVGCLGYVDAARELEVQLREGVLPLPDAVVVGLGSGGTVAGLLAGFAIHGIRSRIVAIRIVPRLLIGGGRTLALARATVRRLGARIPLKIMRQNLEVDARYLGAGYGHPTPWGARATELASGEGLMLEPTYTAKAFAAALDRVARGGSKRVLFWHTFSSVPLEPLLARAPTGEELPPALRALFTG
jgi:1-aminocyclopropane-1-carboxylate deaminase/D-cysteine desulfhydrase-like pyridoxal-dependent ACC family enzyme